VEKEKEENGKRKRKVKGSGKGEKRMVWPGQGVDRIKVENIPFRDDSI